MQLSLAGQRLSGSAGLKAAASSPVRLEAELAAPTWTVAGLPPLSAIQARVAFEPGRLQVEPFSFAIAGGQARGQLRIGLPPRCAPRIDLQLSARSMAIESLEAGRAGARLFKGGRANLDAKLAMSGRTAWALAGSSTGEALLTARDVGLVGRTASTGRDILARLIDALIPTGQSRDNLVVECAVVRLPLRNGVAAIDRSIAVETRQIGHLGQRRDQSGPAHPLAGVPSAGQARPRPESGQPGRLAGAAGPARRARPQHQPAGRRAPGGQRRRGGGDRGALAAGADAAPLERRALELQPGRGQKTAAAAGSPATKAPQPRHRLLPWTNAAPAR